MNQCLARLTQRNTSGAYQELRFEAPGIARSLGAGQPILTRTGSGKDVILRRALYPLEIDSTSWWSRIPPDGDWGLAWLRTLQIGSDVDCIGPVGHGFAVPTDARNLLFMGEGDVGWTLLPAIRAADAIGANVAFALKCWGPRQAMPVERLPERVEYRVHLERSRHSLAEVGSLIEWADALLCAGSLPYYQLMLGIIRERRFKLSRGFGQILYPATIFCGTGACQACTADLASGRRRICLRGPVMDLAELDEGGVKWQRSNSSS